MTLNIVSSFNGVSDPDAATYIEAVEAADGELLEFAVGKAINDFVLGCKADGIWDAIKASCILAGARTLNGALVPLVGPAPTNPGGVFVSADYSRKTGLRGNRSNKYLNSNRTANADPQNNQSMSVYVSTPESIVGVYIGAGGPTETGATHFGVDYAASSAFFRSRSTSYGTRTGSQAANGFFGMSRSSSTGYNFRVSGSTTEVITISQTPVTNSIYVFGRNASNALDRPADGRIAFYSIGESLDLALLDARVTDLITAFGAAIP